MAVDYRTATGFGSPNLNLYDPSQFTYQQAYWVPDSSTQPQSNAGQVTIGLPSPLNQKIPTGVGAFAVQGQLWVNPKLLGGVDRSEAPKTKINIVLGVCDTEFPNEPVTLVSIKANDTYIYRTIAPTRNPSCTLRFYDGTQAALDPLLEANLANPTYWPKMAYLVLEGFDLQPYGGQLPAFQIEVATALDTIAPTSEEATINFGAFHSGTSDATAYDRARNLCYQTDYDSSAGVTYLLTIDIGSNEEINRVQIGWAAGTFSSVLYLCALEGSDYITAILLDDADSINKLCLIHAPSGAVQDVLAPLTKMISGVSTPFEPAPWVAVLLDSTAATRYLVFCDVYNGSDNTVDDCPMMVALADISAKTLSTVVHQFTNPLASTGTGQLRSIDFGPVSNSTVPVYFSVYGTGGFENNLWQASVSVGSQTTSVLATGTDIEGVIYSPDKTVVFKQHDGTAVKVDATGTVIYSVAGTADLLVNYYGYQTFGEVVYRANPGYAYGICASGANLQNVYLIDLSTGADSLVMAKATFGGYGRSYVDQVSGYFCNDYDISTTVGMIRFTLGDASIPLTNLETILTKFAVFKSKMQASDLVFTNFDGNECYGWSTSQDITMDAAEQDARDVFDVKIVPSDGKRKYIKAKRDGSFSVDDTVSATAIVEGPDGNITKAMQSDDTSLWKARLSYPDKNAGYASLPAEYARPNSVYTLTRSDKIWDGSTNFVLSSGQAMQAVTTKVYRSNFGQNAYSLTVAPEKFRLEPADIVQFDFASITTVCQINEANLSGSDFTQQITVTEYVQAIDATFGSENVNLPALTTPALQTRFIYLDGPLIDLGDDLGGSAVRQYALVGGYGYSDFAGATLYRSPDGTTYGVVGSISGVTPVVGVLQSISATPSVSSSIDAATTLTVGIVSGNTADLATVTEAEVLAGSNRAMVGAPGRWTMIFFETVSFSGKIATLTNILWSRPFVQDFMDQLAAGDYFVFLPAGTAMKFSGSAAALGDTFYYKAANDYYPLSSVPTESHALAGTAEKPFPCFHLDAVTSGSDLVLSCDHRSRLDATSAMTGVAASTSGEASLSFEWDIMDSGSVVRTLTSSTASVTYASADITTDFGSMPGSITFRVYQMSALVGRGYVAEATVTLGYILAEDGSYILAEDGSKIRQE